MHALIPFAVSLDPDFHKQLSQAQLPQLERLLVALVPEPLDPGDELSLSPPHERVLAYHYGLPMRDGLLPWAALAASRQAAAAAEPVSDESPVPATGSWAFITPCHWQMGQDHVAMTDPANLALSEEHSLRLMHTMTPYFAEDGIELAPHQAGSWLARSDLFENLACASLDRVAGRDVAAWLPRSPAARTVRRLQSEMQMLLYTDPVNAERERQGQLPVNSFWIGGCGQWPESLVLPMTPPSIDTTLRQSAIAQDAAAHAQAWQALDASLLADLNRELEMGHPVSLSLCGERGSITWTPAANERFPRAARLWRRLRLPARKNWMEQL